MNKAWEYVIDIFVGMLIMFVSITIYFGIRTESVMKSIYSDATENFVSEIKKDGFMTLNDYERYIGKMGTGGSLFNISYEHRYSIFEPEYRFKTLEEIIEDQDNAYGGPNDYHYRDVITEKPHVNDPINEGNLNKDTNESVLAKAANTPADPNHVHGPDCYSGHKHIGDPTFLHTHQHTYSCVEFISERYVDYTCGSCGQLNHRFLASYYWDETTKSVKLGMSNGGIAGCMACGSQNLLNLVYLDSYNYSCGYYIDINGDGYTDAVGRDRSYEYIKMHPPSDTVSTTFNSGCYTYHKTKTLEFNINNDSSIRSAFSRMMTDNFQGYCKIPEFITIGISTYDFYSQAKVNGRPNLCRVTYRAYKSSNGSIRFAFYSYWGTRFDFSKFSGTDNPGFPSDISVAQFKSYQNQTPTINNWFKQFFSRDYYSVNDGSINFHSHWFDRQWNSDGYMSWQDDTTQYLDICDYDHALGVDKWLHTCGLEEDGTINCNEIIVSLLPTHSNQTVYTNDPLITTAEATYQDGSKKTVVCSTNFSTAVAGQNKTATLTYNYTINGKVYNKTCTVKVNIIPRNKTCTKGHTYNLNDDGSDPGCPYCRAWIESIRIIHPTTSPIVITIGTTLQDNGVKLLATYMDGHTEEVSSGYSDNLDTNYLGTKPVTIGYKGASVTVMVTTVCATMICDICGYEYNLYPDGTNPGCPRCIQKIPVFTGNIMGYEHINHTEEILQELYDKEIYRFDVNDIFSISVSNKSSNIARRLLRKAYPSLTDRWFTMNKTEHVMSK